MARAGRGLLQLWGSGQIQVNGFTARAALPAYITYGDALATVDADGIAGPFTGYHPAWASGSAADHVKLRTLGTSALPGMPTRASLSVAEAVDVDLSWQRLTLATGGRFASGVGGGKIRAGVLGSGSGEMLIRNRSTSKSMPRSKTAVCR